MRLYLDASVLVALLMHDVHSKRADALLRSMAPLLVISDFASAEFASAIARLVRTQEITAPDAQVAFTELDTWIARSSERVETTTADVRSAEAFLRRLDLSLRIPDALNIAIAQRVGAAMATFDTNLARSAQILGTSVVSA